MNASEISFGVGRSESGEPAIFVIATTAAGSSVRYEADPVSMLAWAAGIVTACQVLVGGEPEPEPDAAQEPTLAEAFEPRPYGGPNRVYGMPAGATPLTRDDLAEALKPKPRECL